MQRTLFIVVPLSAALLFSGFGCVRGDREPLGVTTAAAAGQVGSGARGVSQRQQISLRALGRMLSDAERGATEKPLAEGSRNVAR